MNIETLTATITDITDGLTDADIFIGGKLIGSVSLGTGSSGHLAIVADGPDGWASAGIQSWMRAQEELETEISWSESSADIVHAVRVAAAS